ncbi:hypothetical protein [Mycobacteroides abscessus]|uniref:hypothetical protein n=1 Tax=Mycobacteroides abscessus TaxID=36809 RepID=UPI001F36C249|nr:hypothetical protein [Mycobacteroides abscessus]
MAVALAGLELVLGEDGVPDGPLPEMRFDKVGFTARVVAGAVGALGVPGTLGDSALNGVLVARGIGGSWCGSTAGRSPLLYDATTTRGSACSTLGVVGTLTYAGVAEEPESPRSECPIASSWALSFEYTL